MAAPQDSAKTPHPSPGTKKMAALLEKIYREQPWQADPNKSDERALRLQADLAAKPSLRNEFKLRQALAENLLQAGDSAGAIEQLEKFAHWLPKAESYWHHFSRSKFETRSPFPTCASASRTIAFKITAGNPAFFRSTVPGSTNYNAARWARAAN